MSGEKPAKKDSLTHKTVSGFGQLASSTILMAAVRIVLVAILARLLTPEDFGIMAAAGILMDFARFFSASGIVFPLVQRQELRQEDIETAFTANLLSAVLAVVLTWIFAGLIADFFRMPALRDVLIVAALIFPLQGMSAVAQKLLERDHRFAVSAWSDVISFLTGGVVVAIVMAVMGFGVWAIVWSQLAQAAIKSALLMRAQRHTLRLRIRWSVYTDLMRQGAGYSLQKVANLAARKGDYFVVGRMLGSDSLGLYERAYTLMEISNQLVMTAFGKVLFPAFARIQDDPARLRRAFLYCNALVALLFLPGSAFCVILAPEIVTVLLGRQWTEAIVPFQILAAGMFFRTGYRVSGTIMNGLGRVYRNSINQTAYALLVIGGAFLFVRWGIVGVAWSTLLAIGVFYLLLSRSAIRAVQTSTRDFVAVLLPACGLAVLTGATAWSAALLTRGLQIHAAFVLLVVGVVTAALIGAAVFAWPRLLGTTALDAINQATGGRSIRVLGVDPVELLLRHRRKPA
jgi:O-antigen/teichoic acid export membrane protein